MDEPEPLPKVKQLPREQIVKDICEIIRTIELTKEQINALHEAIIWRVSNESGRK